MTPVRKPFLQRLKATLAGVCARLFRRKPAPTPTPEPQRHEPSEEERRREAEAAFLKGLETLMQMFEAWQRGELPPASESQAPEPQAPKRGRARTPASRPRSSTQPRQTPRHHPIHARRHTGAHALTRAERTRQNPHFPIFETIRAAPSHALFVPLSKQTAFRLKRPGSPPSARCPQ